MDNVVSLANTASGIGRKLRLRRKVKKLPLAEIAHKTGLSIGLLSQIERGLSTPSLRSLNLVCNALEMPMSWLFDADDDGGSGEDSIVVRENRRRQMDLGSNGMSKEILSPDCVPQIQLMRFVLHPGSRSGLSPSPHPTGTKSGTVLSGHLGLKVDNRDYILSAGDSFGFLASSEYRFWCEGNVDCVMIWAVTPAIY